MTEREMNEKISAWIGKKCTCVTEYDSDNLVNGIPQKTTYWGGCDMHSLGGLPTPYVTSDRCAVELLPALVEKGLGYFLSHSSEFGHVCGIYLKSSAEDAEFMTREGARGSISAAIADAIHQLIDAEKTNEMSKMQRIEAV